MSERIPDKEDQEINHIADTLSVIYLQAFGNSDMDVVREHAFEIYAKILRREYGLDPENILESVDQQSLGKVLLTDSHSYLCQMTKTYIEKGHTELGALNQSAYQIEQRRKKITEQLATLVDQSVPSDGQPQTESFKDYLKAQIDYLRGRFEKFQLELDILPERVIQQIPQEETPITYVNDEAVTEQVRRMEEIIKDLSKFNRPSLLSDGERKYFTEFSDRLVSLYSWDNEKRAKSTRKKIFSWLAVGFAVTSALGGYLGHQISGTKNTLDQRIAVVEQKIGQRDQQLVSEIENRCRIKVKIIENMLREEVSSQVQQLQKTDSGEVTAAFLEPAEETKKKKQMKFSRPRQNLQEVLKNLKW